MSAVVQLLRCQEDAARVAYADRERQAFAVVAVAIENATALIREGKRGRAQYVLARAELSARRILGEAVPS